MRLIDADALTAEHCKDCKQEIQEECKANPICSTLMWINDAPSIDPESLRPHGRWNKDGSCSVCGKFDNKDPYGSNFCPNCGAKMDGDT